MGGLRGWGYAQQWVFLLGVLVALAWAPAGHAQGKPAQVVGGNTVMSPEEAPWSVFISTLNAEGSTLCSGSIIAPGAVLTAAHCVFDGAQRRPASAFAVIAGIVDGRLGADWTRIQSRQVTSVAVHPEYDPARRGYDVAVLTVSTPFDLSGAAVRAIPLGPAGAATGPVRVYGWGRSTPTTRDDRLHSLDHTLVRPYRCLNGVPALLCGQSATGATCFGDSGGGLVVPGPPAKLVGVESVIVGDDDAECGLGERTGYIDVTAPAIAEWLAGNTAPPPGPRTTARPTIVPGDPLICQSPAWTGGATGVSFDFLSAETGQLLQSGPPTYRPAGQDLGHPVTCVAVARNAGGTAEALATAPVTMYDPGLGLEVAANGMLSLSRATPDAPFSRLVVYDRDGKVFSAAALDLSKPVTVPKLPSGRYQVCVQSDPTPTYVAGSACRPWVVAGKAANLVALHSVRRWHGLWRVALRTSPGLAGKRVTLRWRIASCRTCKARTVAVRRKLSATTRVNSPRVPRARVIRLAVTASALTYDGVPYARSRRTLKIHR